jgi:hypothetical protein
MDLARLLCRYDHRRQGRRPPAEPGRVRRRGRAGGIARAASVVSSHTARQIVSLVSVHAADQPAVHRRCPGRPLRCAQASRLCPPPADGPVVTGLMRRLVEHSLPMVLGATRPAPQRQVALP